MSPSEELYRQFHSNYSGKGDRHKVKEEEVVSVVQFKSGKVKDETKREMRYTNTSKGKWKVKVADGGERGASGTIRRTAGDDVGEE